MQAMDEQNNKRSKKSVSYTRSSRRTQADAYSRERYHARNATNNRVGRDGAQYRDRARSRGVKSRPQGARGERNNAPTASKCGAASTSSSRAVGRVPKGFSLKVIVVGLIVLVIVVAGLSMLLSRCSGGAAGVANHEDTEMGEGAIPAAEEQFLPTPYMAESSGVKLHCAIRVDQLTEILIHNASYTYANPITTELTEATNTEVMAAHGTGRVASEQPTGDNWLTGEFIRCFRSESVGSKMSAIDCGGPVGATVYAPVSGTVVRVKKYDLYGNADYPDYQIHIQPDGRDDIDVVLIHLTDVSVKEGDTVEGGVTPMAKVRDVYAYIGDSMQLKSYTAKGDNGNHTHIQVNDATNKEYTGLK